MSHSSLFGLSNLSTILHATDVLCGFYFRWAAYVAGSILVLMTELGVRFEDSISMLVQSSLFPFLTISKCDLWNTIFDQVTKNPA